MHRGRLASSVVLFTAGIGLLSTAVVSMSAAAQAESRAVQAQRGGTLRVDLPARQRYFDPTLSISWQLMHATHLQLLGYPDGEGDAAMRVVPEAAARPRVSPDGRTYTFTIRRGFRFSNGEPVTAANFAHSINRALNPAMQAYAARYVSDIVGAGAVQKGEASTASGVRARGQTLTIRLVAPAPDLPTRIALPHFPALPLAYPIDPEGVSQTPLHSAGPYYLREVVPGRSGLLVRNPYWQRRLLPRRPANFDRIVFTYGNSPDAIRQRLERDETDLGPIPGSATADLHRRFGLNDGRFFVRRTPRLWHIGFNAERSLFRDNVRLRRAVNFAIDRPHLARQFGFLAGARTDQILVPTVPGFADAKVYPIAGADVARAREMARGSTRTGSAVLYIDSSALSVTLGEIIRFNLRQIGLDVEVRAFALNVFLERVNRPDEPYDMALLEWFVDYPDPANLFDDMLGQPSRRFRHPGFDRRIAAARRLSGDARYDAYARLDRDIMRELAPIAPLLIPNSRVLVSPSLGCFSFHPVMQAPNLVALCRR